MDKAQLVAELPRRTRELQTRYVDIPSNAPIPVWPNPPVREERQRPQSVHALMAGGHLTEFVTETMPGLVAYWDRDLLCRFANRAYLEWFGRSAKTVIGTRMQSVLGEEEFAQNEIFLRGVLAGERQHFERDLIRADGSVGHTLVTYIPDSLDGEVIGFMAHLTDVTLLRQTEAELKAALAARDTESGLLEMSRAQLAEAERLGRIGSWVWHVSPEAITWSPEIYRILGRHPAVAAIAPSALAEIFTPDSWASWLPAIERALHSGTPFQLELEFLRPDGRHGWIEARGEALVDRRGLRGTWQDITLRRDMERTLAERRRLDSELAEQHEMLRVTLQLIGDAVITTDSAGCIAWLNPTAEVFTGWSAVEAKGLTLPKVFQIIDEATGDALENPVTACLHQGKAVRFAEAATLVSRDGRQVVIDQSATPIRSRSGEISNVVLVFRDVSETRRMAGEMKYRAIHDPLTGLINRPEFENRFVKVFERSRNDGTEHALLHIDLDQFKVVNDSCGHAIGDQVLQHVSRLLSGMVRTSDTVARMGGDEFAIILEGCETAQAQAIAQKICEKLEHFRFEHEGKRCRVGTSIGLVPVNGSWKNMSAIWQAGEIACHAAKEAGRNRVHVWYETDLALRARQQETCWTSRIEQALDEDGFVLFAQRILPLRDMGAGTHAEILLRMRNKDDSLAPPGDFLPAAERFHLVSRIDRWVLKRAVSWMKNAVPLTRIDSLSINLSGLSVGDRAFQAWAGEFLAEAGPAICSCLCLEITETAAITNPADAAAFIGTVRSLGVKVALDDFGAGASSFGYLKNLPVDYLKIDGQFIRDLVNDKLDSAAVRCFVDVAKAVGMATVAEFVDDPAVLARLREIGVDFAQGFLIHRPEPIEALLE